jgi:hypothetical protein
MEHAALKRAALALWYVSTTNYEAFTDYVAEMGRDLNPEQRSSLRVDSPYTLWSELWEAFAEAYDKTPPDESLIRRMFNTRPGAVMSRAAIAPMTIC